MLDEEMRRRLRRHERSPSIVEIPDSPELAPTRAGGVRRREGEDGRPQKRARVDGVSTSGSESLPAPERREAEPFFDALSLPPANRTQEGAAHIEEISSSPERPTSTQLPPSAQTSTAPRLAPTTQPSVSSPPSGSQVPGWTTQPSHNARQESASGPDQDRNETSAGAALTTSSRPETAPSQGTAQVERSQAEKSQPLASTQVNGPSPASAQGDRHERASAQAVPRAPVLPQTPVRSVLTEVPSTPSSDPKLEEHERRLAELEAQLRMLRELIPTPARSTQPVEPVQMNGHVPQAERYASDLAHPAERQSDAQPERQMEKSASPTRQPTAGMDVADDAPATATTPAASDSRVAETGTAVPNGSSEDGPAPASTSQTTPCNVPKVAIPSVSQPPLTAERNAAPAAVPTATADLPALPSPPAASLTEGSAASEDRNCPPPPPSNTQAPPASQSAQPARSSPSATPDPQAPAQAAQSTQAEPIDDQLATLKTCLAFMESEYRRADRERGALVSENEKLRKEIEAMKLANARLKLRVQITRERQGNGGTGSVTPVSQLSID